MLVSANEELIEFAAKFRNYGKFEHEVDGLNFRMSEFTAALALVQAERMEEIVAWKNEYAREHLDPVHPARLELPEGMTSGYYKYIVFERDREEHRAASTTSPATASWAAPTSCRTPTGWPRTTGACRSTTAPRAARRP